MISSSSIRFQLLLSTAVAASLALPARAIAAPLPVPAAPNPNITTSGNTETVVLTNPRTVINWRIVEEGHVSESDIQAAAARAMAELDRRRRLWLSKGTHIPIPDRVSL